MALINCPECNKEISDKAIACPNCGAPLRNNGVDLKHRLPNTSFKLKYIAMALFAFVILPLIFYFGHKKFGNNALKEKQQSEISKSPAATDTSSIKHDTIANKEDNTDTGKLAALVIKKEKPNSINAANQANEKQSGYKTAYCWYGWQEKKLGYDYKKGEPIIYNITNYASEVFSVKYSASLTIGEVQAIVEAHIETYCPIEEKPSGKGYSYVISVKIEPSIGDSYEKGRKSRKDEFGSFEEISICSLAELQSKIINAKHTSHDDLNKNGVNLYCVANWIKFGYNDAEGHMTVTRYQTKPFKINCASLQNVNDIPDIVKDFVKSNCNIPSDYIVGVSSFGSYQSALNDNQKQRTNTTIIDADLCSENKLQDEICRQK